ncbi:MAG: hypothetical protein COC16_03715 [Lutibacter sp.]|nr:MAG: hypothetical protein COC16_03715 [Lutibacter sp.]
MKRKRSLFFIFFFSLIHSFAQGNSEDAWVSFNDKPSESIFIGTSLTILTQRTLDRRFHSIKDENKSLNTAVQNVIESRVNSNNPPIKISFLSKRLFMVQVQYGDSIKTIKTLKN